MPINNETTNFNFPLPHQNNTLKYDVNRLRAAINLIDQYLFAVAANSAGTRIAIPAGSIAGDMLYFDGTVYTRFPAGATGQVLKSQGTAGPVWSEDVGTGIIDCGLYP